ncbi:MAG: hypothetical protein VXV96_09820 [Bdellovibrionota bacterium]|nr:hypothetical protein [Bdellovibrionota bacterium]
MSHPKDCIIYCDSINALEKLLRERPALNGCLILTSSPALLKAHPNSAVSLYSKMSEQDFIEERNLTKKIIKTTFDYLGEINCDELSLVCASKILSSFQIFNKLHALTCHGKFKKLIICKYKDEVTKKTELLNLPLEDFIPSELYEIYEYEEHSPYQFKHDKISFGTRIGKAGIKNIFYRLLIKFYQIFPNVLSHKKIFIYKENDLLMEAAVDLAIRGFSLHYIRPSKDTQNKVIKKELSLSETDQLISDWNKKLDDIYKPFFSKYVHTLLNEEIYSYHLLKERWKESFNLYDKKSIMGVLTNSPSRVDSRSLHTVLKNYKIPLISFQHGVTREISKYHDLVEINFEGNSSDYFITFNKMAEEISKASYYSQATTFTAGTSKRFTNIPRKISSDSKNFVYVSTNLPRGHVSYFMGDHDDCVDSAEEEKVIRNILAKVNTTIDFKPYLFDNRRFPDRDYISKDIEEGKFKNIHLLKDKVDMRYLLNKYEVIITTKATSTVSWPILGNRPTVFLNFDNSSPVAENVKVEFEKSLFFFDIKDEEDYKKVVDFLNLPLNQIKQQWVEKSSERRKLVKKYFSDNLKSGSKNAAKFIKSELNSPKPL